MKLFARVGIAALLAVCAVTWAGLAWADENSVENSVVEAIKNFGLARKPNESGSTITIVNASETPLSKDVSSFLTNGYGRYWLLDLGDITGITIDWKANLTVTGEWEIEDGLDIVLFQDGTFNMTAGTIDIQRTGIGWINTIEADGASTVTVDGGTLKGTGAWDSGIGADDENGSGRGKVIVTERGKVNFPNGFAITTNDLRLDDPSVITGATLVTKDDFKSISFDIYGKTSTVDPRDAFDEETTTIAFTVKDGATWTVKSSFLDMPDINITILIEGNGKLIILDDGNSGKFPGKSTINIRGTVINSGRIINEGTINNYSSNTLDNQGTLTNTGTINNTSTGKITNTGTIANEGTFTNDGKFTGSKLEGNGTINGANADEATPESSTSSGGGSGGCDAGYGLFGLLPLVVWVARKRIAA